MPEHFKHLVLGWKWERKIASVVAERGGDQILWVSLKLKWKIITRFGSCPVLPRVSGQGLPVMAGLPCLFNQLWASRGDRPCVLIIQN